MSVKSTTLPSPSLSRFSKAVTLRLLLGLFLLSPFAVLTALPIVKSGRSSPDRSVLKVKRGKINSLYISFQHPGSHIHKHTHLGRFLVMLELAGGSCGPSDAAVSCTIGVFTGSVSHNKLY